MSFFLIGAMVVAGCAGLLYFFQHRMIYHPQPYREDYSRLIPQGGVPVQYKTSCGKQTAFYVPPLNSSDETSSPQRLWIMFGGNASLALFWKDTVDQKRDEETGFLLVDYPGYGLCEGAPTPAAMDESADGALAAVADLAGDDAGYRANLCVIGHSLGSGVATSFATRHAVRKLVLVAPFTSLRAAAREVVGRLPATLLRHHYDNDKALEQLAGRENLPEVIIIHGAEDTIIPAAMSRELKRQFSAMIEYLEVPGGDHVDVLDYVPHYM